MRAVRGASPVWRWFEVTDESCLGGIWDSYFLVSHSKRKISNVWHHRVVLRHSCKIWITCFSNKWIVKYQVTKGVLLEFMLPKLHAMGPRNKNTHRCHFRFGFLLEFFALKERTTQHCVGKCFNCDWNDNIN